MLGRLMGRSLVLCLTIAMIGCSGSKTEIPLSSPTIPFSATPPEPSVTFTVTPSIIPPTFTPFPPTSTPEIPDATVCESGCSFQSVQAAVDALGYSGPVIIEIVSPEHTEGGIIVREGQSVIIRGLGPEQTVLQAHETLAGSTDRVILIEKGGEAVLQGLTIRHGRPAVEEEHGGGVNTFGKLTIINCLITENSARGGGGVSAREADLTILSSTIEGNTARGDGPRGLECGGGGGVKCSSGTMTLMNSAVVNNTAGLKAEGLGGGVRVGCGCQADIINTTVANNQAVRYGSGIAAGGEVQIIHATLVGNKVKQTDGGALWIRGNTTLINSLIADNSGGLDCVIHIEGLYGGVLVENSNNLITDGSCDPDYSGEAKLDALGDHGGLTVTIPLMPDSPAVDAVPLADCLIAYDQRGEHRSLVLFRPESPCDIGAFELQMP